MEYILYPHNYAVIFENFEYYYKDERLPLAFVIDNMKILYPVIRVYTNDLNHTVALRTFLNGVDLVVSEDIFGGAGTEQQYTKMIEKLKTIAECGGFPPVMQHNGLDPIKITSRMKVG